MTKPRWRWTWSTAVCVLSAGCAGEAISDGGRSTSSTASSGTSGSGGSAGSSVVGTTTATTSVTGVATTTAATSGIGSTTVGSGGQGGSNVGTTTTSGTAGSGAGGQSAGGAGGAQGATDGGSPSGDAARTDGGAPGCVGVVSKFCDDFEKQTAGRAPTGDFTVGGKAGSMIVDTTKAYSGTQSLHITSAKPSAAAMLQFTKQFPTNDVHGRAMYFMTRVPSGIHWDVAFSYSTNNVQWEVGGMFGKFMFVVDPPDHAITSITFPVGRWFCLQWEFKYGGVGVDNTFLAKMDGNVLDKGQFTGADPSGMKWNGGPWRNLDVGWTGYGSSDVDIEMWVDDVAFGDQPIACPSPGN